MVKKVVIAAAGRGTRMMDLSKDKPKHLIEVNGRPFLSYLLDNLFWAGYKDIILVGGYMSELMEDFAKNYIAPGGETIKIKFINQFSYLESDKKYGTACPLMCVKDEIKEQFIYVCGDSLFSVDDLKLINIEDSFCYVAGIRSKNPEKYGVILGSEFLEEIIEKPKEFIGDIISPGLYKFTEEVFDKLAGLEISDRGEYEITDVISLLAKERKVKIKILKDYFKDFGSPDDVKEMSNFLNNGNNKGK